MSAKLPHSVGVVILAAGKGSRLNCDDMPKVMLEIGGAPIVSYTVATLEQLGFAPEHIVMVVGFQQEKVRNYFGERVTYAEQTEQKGTAHAAFVGMQALPTTVDHVLVLGGDDSAFYSAETLRHFLAQHEENNVVLSLLSTRVDDPSQYGRVVRHPDGPIEIIEKEYVTPEQAKIDEISTGTFCFDRNWFEAMFPAMPPLRKLNEFGLPTALATARNQDAPHQVVEMQNSAEWFGINTPAELEEAGRRKKTEKQVSTSAR